MHEYFEKAYQSLFGNLEIMKCTLWVGHGHLWLVRGLSTPEIRTAAVKDRRKTDCKGCTLGVEESPSDACVHLRVVRFRLLVVRLSPPVSFYQLAPLTRSLAGFPDHISTSSVTYYSDPSDYYSLPRSSSSPVGWIIQRYFWFYYRLSHLLLD